MFKKMKVLVLILCTLYIAVVDIFKKNNLKLDPEFQSFSNRCYFCLYCNSPLKVFSNLSRTSTTKFMFGGTKFFFVDLEILLNTHPYILCFDIIDKWQNIPYLIYINNNTITSRQFWFKSIPKVNLNELKYLNQLG